MSDAFVLGAGFSMAISPLMVSTDGLGERVLALQRSIHANRSMVHSSICDGLSCDYPILRGGGLAKTNFEVWLSMLAEAQPHLLSPENDRRHALFTELTGLIAAEVDSSVATVMREEAPKWLIDLILAWHRLRAGVVTFNYDTFVEAAFEQVHVTDPDDPTHPLGHVHIGPAVLPWWEVGFDGLRHRSARTFRYYKLHGSTDWYWDETTRAADSIVEVGLRSMWGEGTARYGSEELEFRAPGKVPMIVPPTTTKTGYFDNPVIRHLWHAAYLSLLGAKRVFVVGYSLPPADILVRSLLGASLDDSEVWIVNPDGEVGDRFSELEVGSLRLEFCGDGPVDMDGFVDAYLS